MADTTFAAELAAASTAGAVVDGVARGAIVDPRLFPRFRKALANVRAKRGNCRIMCVGDSTTRGVGATGIQNGPLSESYPAVLSRMFTGAGISSRCDAVFGDGNRGTSGLLASNPGLSLGSGWLTQSPIYSIGGFTLFNGGAADTSAISYVPPGGAFDRIEITYLSNSTGDSMTVDIGGVTLATIDTLGTSGNQKQTISCAKGLNTVNIRRVGTAGRQLFVVGIRVFDSTNPQAEVINVGIGSSTTDLWSRTTPVYSTLGQLVFQAPDLAIISLGINDWLTVNSVPTATTLANLQTIITAAKAVSDVLLVSPVPSSVTSAPLAAQAAVVAGYFDLAKTNNVPLVDFNGRLVDFTTSNALGLYWDSLHLNLGYYDMAASVYDVLKPAPSVDFSTQGKVAFAPIYSRFLAGVGGAPAKDPHSLSVMASPPTVTTSTTEPPTSGNPRIPASATVWDDYAPYLRLSGGWPIVNGGPVYAPVQTRVVGAATGGGSTANNSVARFATVTRDPAPTIGISMTRRAPFRLIVDDQYTSLSGYIPAAANQLTFYKFDFGSAKRRVIQIETQGGGSGAAFTGSITSSILTVTSMDAGSEPIEVGMTLYGGGIGSSIGSINPFGTAGTTGTGGVGTYGLSGAVNTASRSIAGAINNGSQSIRYLYPSAPAYNFYAPPKDGLRMIIAGDSYTFGPVAGQNAFSMQGDGLARIAGDALGISDTWCSGASSAGYLYRGSGGVMPNMLDRITDVTAWAPDILVIPMGGNDIGAEGAVIDGITIGPATLQTRMVAYLSAVRSALPTLPIIVVGPWFLPSSSRSTFTTYETAMAAAVALMNDKMIVFEPTISSNWQFGTGNAYVPNGSGNSDFYISGYDRIHPTFTGHADLGYRLAGAVRSGMTRIAAALGL